MDPVACRLILNADDFGAATAVNEAVQFLAERGSITSASLLATGVAAAEAVRIAYGSPGLAVGLHLAFVELPSALPAGSAPHLAPAGQLHAWPARVALGALLSRPWREELLREAQAQLHKYLEWRMPRDHLDTHLHLAAVPPVLAVVEELAVRHGFCGVRVPRDHLALCRRAGYVPTLRERLQCTAMELVGGLHARRLECWGLIVPQRSLGFLRSGRLTEAYLVNLVRALPPGSWELHCHPRLDTAAGRRETTALASAAFREALEERGVERVTYSALRKRVQGEPCEGSAWPGFR